MGFLFGQISYETKRGIIHNIKNEERCEMRKRNWFKTIAATMAMALAMANGPLLSYARASVYDDLQVNGELRLIVRFSDFVSDNISLKLGDRDEVVNNDLNEYILRKIDEKYNLKKLRKRSGYKIFCFLNRLFILSNIP